MRKKSGGHRSNNHRGGKGKYRSGGGGGGGHIDSQSLARQKKHALTQKEKYLAMARDAQSNGERVEAEYYYQHVEHYSRVISDIQSREEPQQDPRDDGADGDVELGADGGDDDDAPAEKSAARDEDNRGNMRRRGPRKTEQAEEEIPLPNSMFSTDEPQASTG